jgi:AP-3 complex subunit beta
VAGSAIHAFEVVCPERIDLIHKNFRKLCNLLIDVDEWGQVVIINMLTRYSRTQFVNPNNLENDDDKDKITSDLNTDYKTDDEDGKNYIIDPDHRLLLRSTKPLLQSRNSSVLRKKCKERYQVFYFYFY